MVKGSEQVSNVYRQAVSDRDRDALFIYNVEGDKGLRLYLDQMLSSEYRVHGVQPPFRLSGENCSQRIRCKVVSLT